MLQRYLLFYIGLEASGINSCTGGIPRPDEQSGPIGAVGGRPGGGAAGGWL